jgi:hypothetical protein
MILALAILPALLAGCTVYHYVDTCTRSQLLMQSPLNEPPMQLPSISDPNAQCERREWNFP